MHCPDTPPDEQVPQFDALTPVQHCIFEGPGHEPLAELPPCAEHAEVAMHCPASPCEEQVPQLNEELVGGGVGGGVGELLHEKIHGQLHIGATRAQWDRRLLTMLCTGTVRGLSSISRSTWLRADAAPSIIIKRMANIGWDA